MVGGVTRLTHSGLSISEWKPIKGTLPPLNETEWNAEFQRYKATPEFKLKNSHFNLNEFKSIFWWEYIHRSLGRLLGLVFILPFIYFLSKYELEKKLKNRLLILFLLGCMQAIIGWLMVKSGLQKKPEVSHLRLATHLAMAFTIEAYILWIIFSLKHRHKSHHPLKVKLRIPIILLVVLCFIQVIYGALVAGLKAGFLFGTFPTMGDKWIDDSIFWAYSEQGGLSLINFGASVQFMHRTLGIVIFLATLLLFAKIQRWTNMPKRLRKGVNAFVIAIVSQVTLGIITLLFHVSFMIALLHQFFALVCFSVLIYLLHVCYYSSNHSLH